MTSPRDGLFTLTFEGSAGPIAGQGAGHPGRATARAEGLRLASHLIDLIAVACERAGVERLTA